MSQVTIPINQISQGALEYMQNNYDSKHPYVSPYLCYGDEQYVLSENSYGYYNDTGLYYLIPEFYYCSNNQFYKYTFTIIF